MDILETAISAEGSVGKLADALGEKRNTVSNWRQRGRVPRGWERVLQLRYGGAKDATQAAAGDPTQELGQEVAHG